MQSEAKSNGVNGRVLALDVGKKRIGLALSDALGLTAQPLSTLHRTRIREDLDYLRALAQEHDVQTLLVGRPLHMSGDQSRQGLYTEEFAARLGEHLGLPVVFWDERLTSAEAQRLLHLGGAKLEQRKKAVDQMSAILLLHSFLEHRRQPAFFDEGEHHLG